jgi:hypothetical protein
MLFQELFRKVLSRKFINDKFYLKILDYIYLEILSNSKQELIICIGLCVNRSKTALKRQDQYET